MPRQWIAIYVDNDVDAKRVIDQLETLKQVVPSLEWDEDWEQDKEVVECPVCGVDNQWDATHCVKCGANLRIETEGDSQS
jgi:ribosomal protein L40E